MMKANVLFNVTLIVMRSNSCFLRLRPISLSVLKNELFETTDCIIAPFHSQCERLHSLFFFVKNYFIILWQFMKNSCFRKYYNLYLTEKLHRL